MSRREYLHISRQHRNELIALIGLLFGAAMLSGYLPDEVYWLKDTGRMVIVISGFGVLAPVVMTALQFVQVVIAPIPGQIFGVVGGYLFGPFWGTIYGIIGMTAGSYVAIMLGRRYGRPLVERFAGNKRLEQFDGLINRHGTLPFFIIYLLPGLPDDAISYIAGLSDVSIKKLVFLNFIGRLPALVAFSMAGDRLAQQQNDMFLILLVVVAVVSIIALAERNKIIDIR